MEFNQKTKMGSCMLMHSLTAWVHFKLFPFDCPWRHLCLYLTNEIKNDRKCLFWVYLCKSARSQDVIAALSYSPEFMRQGWWDTSPLEKLSLTCIRTKVQFPVASAFYNYGKLWQELRAVTHRPVSQPAWKQLGFQGMGANSQLSCMGMLLKSTDSGF